MSIKITDSTAIIKSQTAQKASIFLRTMADELVTLSTPGTPRDKGNLRQDIIKQVLGLKGKVVWGKNYAAYQERGVRRDGSRRVRKYTTPGTGAHFAQNAAKLLPGSTVKIAKGVGLI